MSKKIFLALSIPSLFALALAACNPVFTSAQGSRDSVAPPDHPTSDEAPPRELQQVILPDGHPEFPADTLWVIVPSDPVAYEAPVPLSFPASWEGIYATDQEGSVARHIYTSDPERQEVIFSITVMTEAEWQTVQSEPHGEALLQYAGLVWVYNPALENPYTGEHADAFSRMVGEAYDIAHGLPVFFTPQVNDATGLPVLETYFAVLNTGNYAEAARIFGGDYTQLVEYNPSLSPDDHAALFESACTVNGFACNLKIGEIVAVEQVSPVAVRFTLTLVNPDGSPFEIGACCGSDDTAPTQKTFEFTVASVEGRFKVMELPVYLP